MASGTYVCDICTPKTFIMKDHIIFFMSAYLLFALFLTIHIFTAGLMAKLIAGFFGASILVNLAHINKEYIKELLLEVKYQCSKIIKYIFIN